jgi:hypothetical protein
MNYSISDKSKAHYTMFLHNKRYYSVKSSTCCDCTFNDDRCRNLSEDGCWINEFGLIWKCSEQKPHNKELVINICTNHSIDIHAASKRAVDYLKRHLSTFATGSIDFHTDRYNGQPIKFKASISECYDKNEVIEFLIQKFAQETK